MHVFYIVETAVCVTINTSILITFILLIRARSIFPDMLGGIHWACHYWGFIGSLLLFTWSWDAQGALGLLSWKAILLLKDSYTCSVYYVLIKCILNGVMVLSKSSNGPRSVLILWLDKWQGHACVISTAMAWMIAAAVDYEVLRSDSVFYYGIFLMYLAVSFTISIVIMSAIIVEFYQIRKSISKPHQQQRTGCCGHCWTQETAKLRFTVFGLAIVISAQTAVGVMYFLHPGQLMSSSQLTSDVNEPHFNLWMLVDIVGQLIILHLSWLPLYASLFKSSSAPESKRQSGPSDLKKSAGSKSVLVQPHEASAPV